jgi:hypothetical protein
MKILMTVCVLASLVVPTAAFSRGGGMGMHPSTFNGGAAGTSVAAPGTNSSGTALSSGGIEGASKGPALGTGDPAVEREDQKAARMVQSICKGC